MRMFEEDFMVELSEKIAEAKEAAVRAKVQAAIAQLIRDNGPDELIDILSNVLNAPDAFTIGELQHRLYKAGYEVEMHQPDHIEMVKAKRERLIFDFNHLKLVIKKRILEV